MTLLTALLLIGAGCLFVFAAWHGRKLDLERKRDRARRLVLVLDDDRRVVVHDERAAENGLYHPDGRKVKAAHQYPPRPPQP